MQAGRLARFALLAALFVAGIAVYAWENDTTPALVEFDNIPAAPSNTGTPPMRREANSDVRPNANSDADFDFYVLALSWSPSYCESEGPDANRQQCGSSRPFGFVVHGLWPQFERGYPQDCDSGEPRNVPMSLARSMGDIMPSTGLINYQWRKHGACSGLSQRDYFATMRRAMERVAIPGQFRQGTARDAVNPQLVERAFLTANPGMKAEGVAVTCDREFLREVRICLTKDLDLRACPEVDRSGCRRRAVEMPPIR
jgi:ribonuclease T2